VYSDRPSAFSHQQTVAWLETSATAEIRLEDDVKEALRDALDIPDVNKVLMHAVEARRAGNRAPGSAGGRADPGVAAWHRQPRAGHI